MVVLRLIRVLAGLEETARGKGLVGFVWMECSVEEHDVDTGKVYFLTTLRSRSRFTFSAEIGMSSFSGAESAR